MTIPATPPTDPGFQPDYTTYTSTSLSVAQLDALAAFVFNNSTAGLVGSIAAGLKLIAAIAYIWARQKMVDNQMAVAKQQYEVAQANADQNEVNTPPPVLKSNDIGNFIVKS
jgi:hypothetical protein